MSHDNPAPESDEFNWWDFYFDWMFVVMAMFGFALVSGYLGLFGVDDPGMIPVPGYGPMFGGLAVAGLYHYFKQVRGTGRKE